MQTYPAYLESDVVLRTGRTLRLRPVRYGDREHLIRFYTRLSPDSLHSRFFDSRTPESAADATPADVDYRREFGIIGEMGSDIVAVAHYFSSEKQPDVAEVAFAIRDDMQGHGIGTRLLEKLADIARTNDITRFEAETLAENKPMLDVFLNSGFEVVSRSDEGIVRVTFPIAPTAQSEARSAERSQKAAYASIRPIFEPRTIAVIGASRRPGQLGNEIVRNLRQNGFRGSLFVVNPKAAEIEGVAAVGSLADIPGAVDLAIISVPASAIESVIDDCIGKGVPAAVVITAGFGETGASGRAAELRLLEKVRAAGMRMVGPNCMGVINTDPAVKMQATFASVFPPAGNIAMSSQSGALGLAILDYARALNIGFSTFVSVGNKTDVSGNDLVQYWAEDLRTKVILLYLESFGNPQKFAQIARRVGKTKPIVVVKAGRSASGARAASSHTGALATDDAIVADMLRQSGVIRTDTLEELFDVASLLANQSLPRGRRVAIVTNAGGPGILAADACEANGLQIALLSDATTKALREFLPAAASVGNPIDMIASASPEHYARTLRAVLVDPNVDCVITIYIPVMPTDAPDIAAVIRESAQYNQGKTIVATFMGTQGVPAPLAPVPSFPFPERAVTALARAAKYAEWRGKPVGRVNEFNDIDPAKLRAIVDKKVATGGGWLDPLETRDLLTVAGIPIAAMEVAMDCEEAADAALRIGFPVAVKAVGPLHKSEVDGVKLGLQTVAAVRDAVDEMQQRLGNSMSGVLVQKMAPRGVELMLGASADPSFGHLIAVGAGGTLVEVLADVAFRIHPLTDSDAEEMLQQVRISKVLAGIRGAKPADLDAVTTAIQRVSALVGICPEVRELDINPLIALPDGVVAVDARVRVEPILPGPPSRRVSY
ncbi:MAG TPA: GNAT family N-acetyltransferase [Thermoanaerobaculia bacterium]|nr:GNAT family N-acetyltransferase [Thermoanaerobaculia bacterium]